MIEIVKVESKALTWYCKKCNTLVEKNDNTKEGENQCQECKASFIHCPECEKQYDIYRMELLSLNENNRESLLYCPDCDYKNLIETAFSEGLKNGCGISNSKSFRSCSKCSKTFQNVRSLKEHIVLCLANISYISAEEFEAKLLLLNYLKLTDTYSYVNARAEVKEKDKFITDASTVNNAKSVIGTNHYNSLGLIKRYCSNCMYETDKGIISSRKCCKKCQIPLNYQCTKCNKQYKYYKSMLYHLGSKCNPGKKYHCPQCQYSTFIKSTLTKHVKHVHSSKFKNIKSNFDEQKVNIKPLRLLSPQNKTSRQKNTLMACKFCPYETQSKINLVIHVRRDHLRNTRNKSKESIGNNFIVNKDISLAIKKYCSNCDQCTDERLQRKCANCKRKLTYQCNHCKTNCSTLGRIKNHLRMMCNPNNALLTSKAVMTKLHMKKKTLNEVKENA